MTSTSLAVHGRFVHGLTGKHGEVEFVEDGLIVVKDGVISAVSRGADVAAALEALDKGVEVVNLADDEPRPAFLLPGLIDCHIHAAQYAYTGTATNLGLMDWLQTYTFPAERKCEDVAYAARVYEALVKRLLRNGTTTGVMYATIHLEATKKLVDICLDVGLRAVIGKVCMDQHGGDGYVETTQQSLADTETFLEYCYSSQKPTDPRLRLVQPSVIPRFIPTCSLELLKGLGALAAKNADRLCWVQSHCAETPDEMAFVESLYPGQRDAEIFEKAGLLTDHCVMAHGVHLLTSEFKLFEKKCTGVACCALSNAFLSVEAPVGMQHSDAARTRRRKNRCIAGAFRLVDAQRAGVRVGLGTDLAGGYATSMLSSCRHAVTASKQLEAAGAPADVVIDYKRAFWTATLGGALATHLEDVVGNFEVGKQFDAVHVRTGAGVYDVFHETATPAHKSKLETEFELFINCGDDRNIKAVFVAGRKVHDN